MVVFDGSQTVIDAQVYASEMISSVVQLANGSERIAIDAPSALSTCPHLDDGSFNGKFRSARCAEIALGRNHKIWVPWVTRRRSMPRRVDPCRAASIRRAFPTGPHADRGLPSIKRLLQAAEIV